MATTLKRRLKRLEAQARLASRSIIRIGVVRQLPIDFVGERHIAQVEPGAHFTPEGWMYSFEERPGPAPASMPDYGITLYISEDDALL
jgi:hypothetical protein